MLQNAISEYHTALTKENNNNLVARNWTYYNLGAIYQKLRRDEEAFFYYNQAQKYQSHFAPTHVGKGVLFMRQGRYDDAASAFKKAIDADADNVSAYGNLGFLFLLTGETEKAIHNFYQASLINPEDAKIMRHLGLAHQLKGDKEEAFIQFKKALTHDKTDPFTLLNLAALYAENGMSSQKEETMSRFFAVFEGNSIRLKTFINSLKTKPGFQDALGPHRERLRTILGNACMEKSRRYEHLADECFHKKGESG